MPSDPIRTLSLPPDQADYIDGLIASGAYASTAEVVGAGLDALRDRDAEIENWLRHDLAKAYDAMQANPADVRRISEVSTRLRQRHLASTRSRAV